MPDVIDFIVLRQAFEIAVSRDWTVGEYSINLLPKWYHVTSTVLFGDFDECKEVTVTLLY